MYVCVVELCCDVFVCVVELCCDDVCVCGGAVL